MEKIKEIKVEERSDTIVKFPSDRQRKSRHRSSKGTTKHSGVTDLSAVPKDKIESAELETLVADPSEEPEPAEAQESTRPETYVVHHSQQAESLPEQYLSGDYEKESKLDFDNQSSFETVQATTQSLKTSKSLARYSSSGGESSSMTIKSEFSKSQLETPSCSSVAGSSRQLTTDTQSSSTTEKNKPKIKPTTSLSQLSNISDSSFKTTLMEFAKSEQGIADPVKKKSERDLALERIERKKQKMKSISMSQLSIISELSSKTNKGKTLRSKMDQFYQSRVTEQEKIRGFKAEEAVFDDEARVSRWVNSCNFLDDPTRAKVEDDAESVKTTPSLTLTSGSTSKSSKKEAGQGDIKKLSSSEPDDADEDAASVSTIANIDEALPDEIEDVDTPTNSVDDVVVDAPVDDVQDPTTIREAVLANLNFKDFFRGLREAACVVLLLFALDKAITPEHYDSRYGFLDEL